MWCERDVGVHYASLQTSDTSSDRACMGGAAKKEIVCNRGAQNGSIEKAMIVVQERCGRHATRLKAFRDEKPVVVFSM